MIKVRCAIYTRKSSEEGLEQGFNSLDAQREACAAYVLSQASEGWQLVPEMYDDGGISGGTLERPALQRLLADVAAGRIDVIVCYKVDRLSRSLFDFAKLVEAFEKADVSFVSITQSFNTTTSMGRLTLNMLLSFAQFEREVTAERIRDKIAASKAKGMWMGGIPPLGYRPDGRSLAIVEEHAELVRHIYARYLALGSVRRLAEELGAQHIRTPIRRRASGEEFGNVAFTRGQLYSILKSPIYTGRVSHKGKTYKGLHSAIIAQPLWDEVQKRLADHVRGERTHRAASNSLLAGKIIGPKGERLIVSHTSRKKVRYRYYVSHDINEPDADGGVRIPAREIEGLVLRRTADLFADPLALLARLHAEPEPHTVAALPQRCAEVAATFLDARRRDAAALVRQVRVTDRQVAIDIDAQATAQLLGLAQVANAPATLSLTQQARLTRTGRALRIVQSDGVPHKAGGDPALIRLIIQARHWWSLLSDGKTDLTALAARLGVGRPYIARVVRLTFLAPAVVDAILEGRQHAALDAQQLRSTADFPALWEEQTAKFLPRRI